MEISIKKKKVIKVSSLIGMTENYVTQEDAKEIIKDLANKLKNKLKHHIGMENSISPYDLFVNIYGVSPRDLDVYKRTYLWDLIKNVLRHMRMTNEMYAVVKRTRIFVLKSQEELEYVKKKIDTTVTSLKKSRSNAEEWVKEQKWKGLIK